MKAIYDRHIVDPANSGLPHPNRGFLYGDGLFETIIFSDGRVKYLQDHFDRIAGGCRTFSLALPDYFKIDYLDEAIRKLIEKNGLAEPVRIKLVVWRRSGGLYEPDRHEVHHLILVNKIVEMARKIKSQVGFSNRVFNYQSPWSSFKTLSSLPYTLAGIEKKERGFDDIILLDAGGNISEFLYSNIFWIREDVFYTPSLNTGCIRGIMRTCLIRKLKGMDRKVEEIEAGKDLLMKADHVFSANVSGLIPVTGIEERKFEEYPDLQDLVP
jgi:branched-subunit amino acid aminotransferase/4-amino-4-deoxychorismate lyase